jgi:aryl-alcohol dehydrogenase-like predicted oxidoreductase
MCKQLGVTPVAHSPIKQGLLSDFALEREDKDAVKVKPLLKLISLIGAINGGKSIEQCALNYLLCRGAVAIPKSVAQLERNAGALGWRLDHNAVEIFNEKNKCYGSRQGISVACSAVRPRCSTADITTVVPAAHA